MKAYEIIAYQDNWRIKHKVIADDPKAALIKFSDKVDQGIVTVQTDGFTGNKRIHITYEELDESEKNRAVETTTTSRT